jgi:hypothetical protein
MIEDMTTRSLSQATRQSYINSVIKFSKPLWKIAGPARRRGRVRDYCI